MGYVLVTLLTLKFRGVKVVHLPLSLLYTAKDISDRILFDRLEEKHLELDDTELNVKWVWDSIQHLKFTGDLIKAFEEGGYRFPEGWSNPDHLEVHSIDATYP